MTISINPCDSVIGAGVGGVSLKDIPNKGTIAAIETALEKYGVLIFRNQVITPEQQVAFSKSFGPLTNPQISDGRSKVPEEILVVGNTGKTPVTFSPAKEEGELEWHSDSMHRPVPARASILHASIVPRKGGDTLFACMYSAYDRLSNYQKKKYDRLKVVNSVVGVQAWLEAQGHVSKSSENISMSESSVIHPLVRTHPRTRRKALYFGNQVSIGIVGWSEEKSRNFIKRLTKHACDLAFQYRHKWHPGDTIIWDNRRVLHAGTAYNINRETRLLYRTTLLETDPVELVTQ